MEHNGELLSSENKTFIKTNFKKKKRTISHFLHFCTLYNGFNFHILCRLPNLIE